MKKTLLLSISLLFSSSAAIADEDYNHFPSLPSPDVATAFCNLTEYNATLDALLAKPELTAVDMVKVHELTYTLENALFRLKETLESSAVSLEEVHQASERLDQETIKSQGAEYRQLVSSLMTHSKC